MTLRYTPNGAPYDDSTITVGTGTATIWVPTQVQDGTSVAVLVMAMGVWTQGQPLAYAAIERGWVVAGPSLSGDTWANDAAMADYTALHAWATNRWQVDHIFLHGTSRGAWACASALSTGAIPAEDITGIISIDGVLNPPNLYAANASFATAMNSAWGTTDLASFTAAIAGRNPAADPVGLYHGKWFITASPADTVVRIIPHAQMFLGRMTDPEHDITFIETTGNHTVEANWRNPEAMAWMSALAPAYSGGSGGGEEPDPPPPGGSSNLRATDGTPVLVRSTAGVAVRLSPP